MAIIESWLPPSREHWELVAYVFKFFPLLCVIQWLQLLNIIPQWYSMGKTSTTSRFNLPGKPAWILMETPGFITLLYIMYSLPKEQGSSFSELAFENKTMAVLFTLHYLHRAIFGPLISPSMSPIHILIFLSAISFQMMNAIQIGGYIAGHGPTTKLEWSAYKSNSLFSGRMEVGLYIFLFGFFGCMFHDEELREIRRAALRNLKRRNQESAADESKGDGKGKGEKESVDKVYMIPQNGLFIWILYPHYLLEWIEWSGFWLMGGSNFIPARTFLINEIVTMLPRALEGRQWYIKRFGKEKIGRKRAVIPGIL